MPTLRFQEKNIQAIARRYDYPIAERELIELKPIEMNSVVDLVEEIEASRQ